MSFPSARSFILTGLTALAAGLLCGKILSSGRQTDQSRPAGTSSGSPPLTPDPARQQSSPASLKSTLTLVNQWLKRLTTGSTADQAAAALELSSLDSPELIRELLKQQHRWPTSATEDLIRTILMSRWSELDPEAALIYTRDHQLNFLPEAILAYAELEPEKARSLLLQMAPGEHRTIAWRNLCLAELPANPQRAWEMLEAAPMRDHARAAYARSSVLEQLVKLDPAGAEKRMATLPADVLDETRQALARFYFNRDAAAGWEWVRRQPNPAKLMTRVLEGVHPDNPAQTVTLLAGLPPDSRAQIRGLHTSLWETSKPALLVDTITSSPQIPDAERAHLARFFFQSVLIKSPEHIEPLVPLLEPHRIERYVNYWMDVYGRQSKADLAKLVQRLPPGMVRDFAEARVQQQQQKAGK